MHVKPHQFLLDDPYSMQAHAFLSIEGIVMRSDGHLSTLFILLKKPPPDLNKPYVLFVT